jgi:hypothetical protein
VQSSVDSDGATLGESVAEFNLPLFVPCGRSLSPNGHTQSGQNRRGEASGWGSVAVDGNQLRPNTRAATGLHPVSVSAPRSTGGVLKDGWLAKRPRAAGNCMAMAEPTAAHLDCCRERDVSDGDAPPGEPSSDRQVRSRCNLEDWRASIAESRCHVRRRPTRLCHGLELTARPKIAPHHL